MASPPKKKKRASEYRRKFGTMRYERIQTKIVFQERANAQRWNMLMTSNMKRTRKDIGFTREVISGLLRPYYRKLRRKWI